MCSYFNIITASECHINLEKSISISVVSTFSCVSSVLMDYCRNVAWKCFEVLSVILYTRGYFGLKVTRQRL